MLSDFNCKILDIDKYKFYLGDESVLLIEAQKLINDINILGSCGFHKLTLPIKTDPLSPFYIYKKSSSKIIQYVKSQTAHKLLGKFSIYTVPVLNLTEETPFLENLEKFTAYKSNYIFFELSDKNEFSNQFFVSLNHLLYKQNILPVFVNIQKHLGTTINDDINRIINIKGAAFIFDLNINFFSRDICTIKHILRNGGIVLLGSSCEHSQLNKSQIEKCINLLKKQLGDDGYRNDFIIRSRAIY